MRLWDLPGVKRFIETACAPFEGWFQRGGTVSRRDSSGLRRGADNVSGKHFVSGEIQRFRLAVRRPLQQICRGQPLPYPVSFRTCVKMKDLQDA